MQKRMDFNWQDLRVFLSILRARSLTAAAKRLGVNQSTVSRRLHSLEEMVGERLLDRAPSGYRLTAAGEQVLPAAERLEADALAMERTLSGLHVQAEGTVRVTATEGIGAFLVAPALPELHRAHPRIEVELVLDHRTLSLSRREADLALRLSRPEQPGLVARLLGRIAYELYAAPRYLEERGRPAASGDLSGHDVLGFDETLTTIPESRWLTHHGRKATLVLRSNSGVALLQATLAGLGMALLPCYLADAAGLVRVLPRSIGLRRELWLAVHADLQHTARIRAVIEFLVAQVEAHAGAFGGRSER
jgi:DNA-binding transcriptional LysR family regulator